MKWISFIASDYALRVRILPGAQKLFKIMKKITIIFLLIFLFIPIIIFADFSPQQGLVPACGGDGQPACRITDFFTMLANIYDFLVKWIASPLAIIAITVGGIILMTSAGNPQQASKGKEILKLAIIGLFLVWGSWVIINFIMTTIGYRGGWDTL